MTRSTPGSGLSSSRLGIALCAALLCSAAPVDAKVFHTREEALALAFPDADRVEDRTVVLDDEQAQRVQELSRGELNTRLVRIHTAHRGDEIVGYAFIDVHDVRTLPEALLVVLSPAGEVRSVRLLAFHEPQEYMPPERWYAQFAHKSMKDSLRLGGDVHGIVGATLSAQATALGVRRALAIYQVVVRGERP